MGQVLAAEGHQRKSLASLPAERQAHPWDALWREETSCLIVPGPRFDVTATAKAFMDDAHASLRIMGRQDDLENSIAKQLAPPLAGYVTELLDIYNAFMHGNILRVRLETITSRACWKWHRDYTTLRLITTLHGTGTEYLPDALKPETIARCQTGEVGLFKGRLFDAHFGLQNHEACVHRSPPWNDTSEPRLLLVIDMPQDFEIDND